MRLVLSIPLLLCLTLACLNDCVVLLSFYINRPYIARNLCEKRDEPGNSCQGCCLLRKQLQNDERREQSPPARNLKEFDDFQPVPAELRTSIPAPGAGEMVFASLAFAIPPPRGGIIDHPPEFSPL
ncbi:MAG TPA: hypothetical protein VK569_06455 [Bacteroidota bacterium]|nr:hypothetical protein [Bacteroidota bacterium]